MRPFVMNCASDPGFANRYGSTASTIVSVCTTCMRQKLAEVELQTNVTSITYEDQTFSNRGDRCRSLNKR